MSKAFRNWKRFGVIVFGSLFLAANVLPMSALAQVAEVGTGSYEVYIDTNGSGNLSVGQSRTFTAQAKYGFGANSDVTAQSKFNWLLIDKGSGQTIDTKIGVGSTYVFTPTATGDYQIRARGFLNGDTSKNAWEKFPALVKVVGGDVTPPVDDDDDDNGQGGNPDPIVDDNDLRLYEVYIDTNLSNPMTIGQTRTYNAQAKLGFGANADVTGQSRFNWLAINLDSNTVVDSKLNGGSSYVFEAEQAGRYQIRARGYWNGNEAKNAWEKFPAYVNVSGSTPTDVCTQFSIFNDGTQVVLQNGTAQKVFQAFAYDQNGDTFPLTGMTWSVTGGANVTNIGNDSVRFTANQAGTYTITASSALCGSATTTVTVANADQLLTVQINPEVGGPAFAGQEVHYVATARLNGAVLNYPVNFVNFTWSLAPFAQNLGTMSASGDKAIFIPNTIGSGKYENIIQVTATYNNLGPASDTSAVIIQQVVVQEAFDHVRATVDRNPINTNDSTLVRAQAYDNLGNQIPNCAYNWHQLSGVGYLVQPANQQVATFASQSVTGTANLRVSATCFGTTKTADVSVSVVSDDDDLRVEITPDPAYANPNSNITFTARAYDGNTDVTNSTSFDWDMLNDNAGEITSTPDNRARVETGNRLGTFTGAIQVVGTRSGMSDTDTATIVIQGDSNPNVNIATSYNGSVDTRGTAVCTDDVITYVITLSNHQPNRANGVRLTSEVPASTNFVSAVSGSGNAHISGRTIIWELGDLSYGQSKSLTIKVAPQARSGNATINATAFVTAVEIPNGFSISANPVHLNCGTTPAKPDGKGPLAPTGINWLTMVGVMTMALGMAGLTYAAMATRRRKAYEIA